MGKAIASHISTHLASTNQPPLLAYNRTLARAQEFEKTHPVKAATTLKQVATESDVIFTCLLNDAAVEQTIEELLPHLKPGAIIVEQSTICPDLVQSLAKKVSQAGASYMACPILGPPAKAQARELIVLVAGGDSQVRARVLPLLLPVIGSKKIELGQDPAESVRLKLCGNFIVTGLVEMMGEYMTLAEASGVGQDKAQELVDAFLPKTMASVYAGRISGATFKDQIHFPISSAIKDASHIVKLAESHNAPAPITRTFLKNCNHVLKNHGDYDFTGTVVAHREEAGLPVDIEKK